MGEVFCSHYVQVSQRVREMGEVFCSHYVQVSGGQRNGRSFLFTLCPGEYNWGSYEQETYRGSNMSTHFLLNLSTELRKSDKMQVPHLITFSQRV